MGDRCNVGVKTREDSDVLIYLYSHSGGYEMPMDLQEALLAAKGRWSDPPYCCRILVSRLVHDHESETGYGLDTQVGDNSYDVLIVDIPAREVRLVGFNNEQWEPDFSNVLGRWSFDNYLRIEIDDSYQSLMNPKMKPVPVTEL